MRRALLLLLVPLAVVLAACGSSKKSSSSSSSTTTSSSTASGKPGAGKPAIVMGTKNFTEEYILGQLYKQALEARGFTVELKNNIGASEVVDKALTSGKIAMYPEYTGVIVQDLEHKSNLPSTAAQTYADAKAFEEKRGFTLLNQTPFEDRDALATLKTYATQHGLKSNADLKKVGHFTLGAPPEFRTRYTGVIGLEKVYGLSGFTFTPLTIGLQYQALDQGKIQAADVFTTDGKLRSGKYTVLEDPKHVFGFQNVAPVVSKSLLQKEGTAFAQTLNAVSATLTDDAMVRMNAAVDIDKNDPAKVAQAFLASNHLN